MSRFDYVKYDDRAMKTQEHFKQAFIELEGMVECLPAGRAKSLILTKLEEAYMWVGKAIRDEQLSRNFATELQEERTNS
jgi:hypothetical protein